MVSRVPKMTYRRNSSVQMTIIVLALAGTMLIVSAADARSTATRSASQTTTQSSASRASLLGNGGFASGSSGWMAGQPRRNTLTVSRSGIDRSAGATVTARRRGTASLWNRASNSAVQLAAGDRVTVSAWVRSTQKRRQAILAARARSGARLVSAATTRVRLGTRGWHHVSTVLRVPRKVTSLRVQIRVPTLKAGKGMVIDNVAALRLAGHRTTTTAARSSVSRTVISANFNALPTGQLTPQGFMKTIGGTKKSKDYVEDSFVAADSRGSGKVLRTRLSKNTYHSSGGNNGISTFIPLGTAFNSGCISYQIRFSPGFGWSLGGKLPGLEGVRAGVAPGYPTGGQRPGDKGWSGRMMWVSPKAYGGVTSPDTALSYMYDAKQTGKYGDNYMWQRPFVAGRWHTVKQCYTMNTVGKANGVLQGWFDSRLVMNRSNLTYRTRNDVGINYLAWHIFRGGNDKSWESPKDGYIDIDNLLVTQN
jgi:hypothetical protein